VKQFSAGTLVVAYAVDLALGDPPGMPHPVRLMGRLISAGEHYSKPGRTPAADILAGTALSLLVVAGSWIAGWIFSLSFITEASLAWTTLATGSLIGESNAVIRALDAADLPVARRLLSRIVGRDTERLNEPEIARAIIETLAESLCDGVVAPLFYLAAGGLPFAMAYKAMNTLDSMIGHPEQPYTYFGRFAARLDDAANLVPARFTSFCIVMAAALCRSNHRRAFATWLQDGHKHPSPNAGQSEAAMAGALGVRLGGTNYYAGMPSQKPVLGSRFRLPGVGDAKQAILLTRVASMLAFATALCYCWRKRKR
jgi:adenosylcobinamide-phosphate synthase